MRISDWISDVCSSDLFAYVDHNIGGACNWRFAVERQHGYGLRLGFPGTPPSCQSRGAITELAPAGLETVENSRRSVGMAKVVSPQDLGHLPVRQVPESVSARFPQSRWSR